MLWVRYVYLVLICNDRIAKYCDADSVYIIATTFKNLAISITLMTSTILLLKMKRTVILFF